MWCKTNEMGVENVPNVQGGSMAQKMTNAVGTNSVHGSVTSVLSNKLHATPMNIQDQ